MCALNLRRLTFDLPVELCVVQSVEIEEEQSGERAELLHKCDRLSLRQDDTSGQLLQARHWLPMWRSGRRGGVRAEAREWRDGVGREEAGRLTQSSLPQSSQ